MPYMPCTANMHDKYAMYAIYAMHGKYDIYAMYAIYAQYAMYAMSALPSAQSMTEQFMSGSWNMAASIRNDVHMARIRTGQFFNNNFSWSTYLTSVAGCDTRICVGNTSGASSLSCTEKRPYVATYYTMITWWTNTLDMIALLRVVK